MHDRQSNESPSVDRIRSEYDAVQYPGGAFAPTQPDHLRVTAALAGMSSAAPASRCRVLEVGCAQGRNLMPMAQSLPDSGFLGIDLSPRQVETGQRIIEQVGLKNIELRCQDMLQFEPEPGAFDYIIAHGVYSWIPAHVRDRLMQICSRGLAPNGIAYISYNTLPGWRLLGIMRDMMFFHGEDASDGPQRAARAREIIAFASQPFQGWKAYKDFLAFEQEQMAKRTDWYLLHEYLEAVNEPVYFLDFARHAAANGLRCLGDASQVQDSFHLLSPQQQEQLERFARGDDLRRYQYIDFLTGRAFRTSVLCRTEAAPPANSARPAVALQQMHVAALMTEQPRRDEATKLDVVRFAPRDSERYLDVSDVGMIAAMGRINSAWPHAVPFSELRDLVSILSPRSNPPRDTAMDLARMLLLAFRLGIVELWTEPTTFLARDHQRPMMSPLARHLVAAGEQVVNLRHQHIPTTPVLTTMAPLLDGTRDRTDLLRDLERLIDAGQLVVPTALGPATATRENVRDIPALLESILIDFHAKSLFASDPPLPRTRTKAIG
jgi:SAM-dependent methyltransferase